MRTAWAGMLRKALPGDLLQRVSYAVFGLGDSGYVQYNVVAKKLDRRLDQLGARRLLEKGLGDDQVRSTAALLPRCLCTASLTIPDSAWPWHSSVAQFALSAPFYSSHASALQGR